MNHIKYEFSMFFFYFVFLLQQLQNPKKQTYAC